MTDRLKKLYEHDELKKQYEQTRKEGKRGRGIIKTRIRVSGAPGREVILGRSDEEYPRHSDADLVRCPDGSMLAVWTRFSAAHDHSRAEIIGRRSKDDGVCTAIVP